MKLTVKLVAIGVAALLVVLLLIWGPAACNTIRGLRTQNAITQGQGGAFKNSSVDAINAIGGVNTNEVGRADQARHDTEEINNAQGAHDPVNPDVYSAGLRAHCRRASSRDDPKCRVLQPRSP